MKKIVKALLLTMAVAVFCAACSGTVDTDRILGDWVCARPDGAQITIKITEDSFTQSSGGVTGEALKYERGTDSIDVRDTDGRVLLTVYCEEDGSLSYTVFLSDGTEEKLVFTKAEQ